MLIQHHFLIFDFSNSTLTVSVAGATANDVIGIADRGASSPLIEVDGGAGTVSFGAVDAATQIGTFTVGADARTNLVITLEAAASEASVQELARAIFEPGHVVWRTKWRRGEAWMSVYDGRELYEKRGRARSVRLLRSSDGLNWTSVSGERSPVPVAGGGECAFEFDAAGNLVALVRVEPRGALVCTAPAHRLESWDCTPTPYRHDSPLLVRSGDRFFAIARRSLGPLVDPSGHNAERPSINASIVLGRVAEQQRTRARRPD